MERPIEPPIEVLVHDLQEALIKRKYAEIMAESQIDALVLADTDA